MSTHASNVSAIVEMDATKNNKINFLLNINKVGSSTMIYIFKLLNLLCFDFQNPDPLSFQNEPNENMDCLEQKTKDEIKI